MESTSTTLPTGGKAMKSLKVFGTRPQHRKGNFFQALIQLAAANLKLFTDNHQAAENLIRSGLVRLRNVPESYMGIDVARLTEDLRRHVASPDVRAPLIRLDGLERVE